MRICVECFVFLKAANPTEIKYSRVVVMKDFDWLNVTGKIYDWLDVVIEDFLIG